MLYPLSYEAASGRVVEELVVVSIEHGLARPPTCPSSQSHNRPKPRAYFFRDLRPCELEVTARGTPPPRDVLGGWGLLPGGLARVCDLLLARTRAHAE